MTRKMIVGALIQDEAEQLPKWFDNLRRLPVEAIVIIDSGSSDNSVQYAKDRGALVVEDDIFIREGAAAARNMLMTRIRKHCHGAQWMLMLDADERILAEDYHRLRFLKDYLSEEYDAVMFPRVDWLDNEMNRASVDYHAHPDWQARMLRLDGDIHFVRKLHECIRGEKQSFFSLRNPKIHHFHQATSRQKRDAVGKLYAKLHREDTDWGHTYGKHPKEDYYYQRYLTEGLG